MSRKSIIGLVGIGVVALHLLLVFFSAVPNYIAGSKAKAISDQYTYPLFYQYWGLYAPEPPKVDGFILIRYRDKGQQWTDWIDPYSRYLGPHKMLRATYHGRISNGIYNLLYTSYRSYRRLKSAGNYGEKLQDMFQKEATYRRVEYFAWRFIHSNYKVNELQELEIQLVFDLPEAEGSTKIKRENLYLQEDYRAQKI